MSFTDLENILNIVIDSEPDLASRLSNDPDYLEEDALVERIAREISANSITSETLENVDSVNWIQRDKISEIPNIYDIVIQATLACSTTPMIAIRDLLSRNPDWLGNGWWCARRLLQNTNLDSSLVAQCAEAAIDMGEPELIDLALEHPNISAETKALIEASDF